MTRAILRYRCEKPRIAHQTKSGASQVIEVPQVQEVVKHVPKLEARPAAGTDLVQRLANAKEKRNEDFVVQRLALAFM